MKQFKVTINRKPFEQNSRAIIYCDTLQEALNISHDYLDNPLGASYESKEVEAVLNNGMYAQISERRLTGVLMNCYLPIKYLQ